jgi:hypothetical protein
MTGLFQGAWMLVEAIPNCHTSAWGVSAAPSRNLGVMLDTSFWRNSIHSSHHVFQGAISVIIYAPHSSRSNLGRLRSLYWWVRNPNLCVIVSLSELVNIDNRRIRS